VHCLTPLLTQWPRQRIDEECRSAYAAYERALKQDYVEYFARHAVLRCHRQPYSAATLDAALPQGWSHLWRLLPAQAVHRFARSGRSSQALALALLGSAVHSDVTMKALWRMLGIDRTIRPNQAARIAFEYPADLQEEPHVTTIDFLATTPDAVAVVECKWSEKGMGSCSCIKDGDGSPQAGNTCAFRVQGRTAYWHSAHLDFGLPPERNPNLFCPVSVAYQAVRNFAAMRNLSGGRCGVFALLYDERNPYFRKTGAWPGWPDLLSATLNAQTGGFSFKAISWQNLTRSLPIPADVREWAAEKHRLG
jgi:hypothetical protein